MNRIDRLLAKAAERDASDLLVRSEARPYIRVHGALEPMDEPITTTDVVRSFMREMAGDELMQTFDREKELDISYKAAAVKARFRVNYFIQKGLPALAFREIPMRIPTLQELGFSGVLRELVHLEQGMIIVTGPTGSGKSTTLSAMVNELNATESLHIVTIEDPMEFVHEDRRCVIDQRELGLDTNSFAEALRRSLRQDPDVILVGEMRDMDTISTAMTAAETGHLVLSTLHTNDAKQSVDRIINNYPPEEHFQVRMKIALSLRAIISQRLLPRADGKGLLAVQEIMINTPTIRRMIESGRAMEMDKAIEDSRTLYQMQSLNQALFDAVAAGMVREEDALGVSNNPNDLRLKIQTYQFEQEQSRKGQRPPAGWDVAPGA